MAIVRGVSHRVGTTGFLLDAERRVSRSAALGRHSHRSLHAWSRGPLPFSARCLGMCRPAACPERPRARHHRIASSLQRIATNAPITAP
jgi:hypothetical protein